jgi:hypothetical protein
MSPIGPKPSTTSDPPSGTSAYSTPCHAVGSTSERNTKRSSDGPSGTLIGRKFPNGTRRNSACPPGVEVQIGAAQAGGGDPDDDVGRILDLRVGDFVHADVADALPGERLHGGRLPAPVARNRNPDGVGAYRR